MLLELVQNSAVRRLVARLGRFFSRRLLHSACARELRGIRTALVRSGTVPDDEVVFHRLESALALIEAHDPQSLRRLKQYADGIIVHGTEEYRLAHWSEEFRACVVTERYAASDDATAELLALTLVHEITHAWLAALGTDYVEGRRARVEVLCAMAELALACRLPGRADLVERAEARIHDWSTGGEHRWSNDAHHSAFMDFQRHQGMPRWLLWLMEFSYRRRVRSDINFEVQH